MKKFEKQRQLIPTPKEAERAIYIDFEGFMNQKPSFAGIEIDNEFNQIIFDHKLDLAGKAKGLRTIEFNEYISSLVKQASVEDRMIAAYSEHELRVIQEYTGLDISDRYLDARKLAKYWKSRCHFDAKVGMGLKDFLMFIGYERPSYLGEQKSTKRIGAVTSMLATKGSYDALTTTVKAQWTKVLQHNRIDVQGMRALVYQARDELVMWNTEAYILQNRMEVIKGDITTLEVDAIVNAANCSLMGGGGVDGAIHRAAGPEMPKACLKLRGCDIGEARRTKGFNLPARHVIHAVGPNYGQDHTYASGEKTTPGHKKLLYHTYRNCLRLATEHRFRVVAFPAISTGAFGYPMGEATTIAIETILNYLKTVNFPEMVILVAFTDKDLRIIKNKQQKILQTYCQ